MEITTSCQSLSSAKFPKPFLSYHSNSFCPSTTVVFGPKSVHVLGFNHLTRKLQYRINSRQLRKFGAVHSSAANTSSSTFVVEKWVLDPIGDGDTRHIGFKTGMPNAFEIASNAVTVGRTPERADVVIPVPTVSGVHARIQKTEESLLITDLDSTNGTFIDEKRLRPGVAATALPGSKITFGNNLSKLSKDDLLSFLSTPFKVFSKAINYQTFKIHLKPIKTQFKAISGSIGITLIPIRIVLTLFIVIFST